MKKVGILSFLVLLLASHAFANTDPLPVARTTIESIYIVPAPELPTKSESERIIISKAPPPFIPTISNISLVSTCNTSVAVSFTTSIPTHTFIEYGLTTSYGSSTVDDPVRFYTEHLVVITGLTSSTLYNFRINATGDGLAQSSNQTFTTAATDTNCVSLPIQVDTRMPDMTGAIEYVVEANCTGISNCFTSLQTAMNTASTDNGKRFITVRKGLIFPINGTIPVNADGNQIIVRTSDHALLPEGKRVDPTKVANFFKIQTPNTDPPLITAAGAKKWRFIGMEVTIIPSALADAPAGNSQSGLIRLGTGAETSESQWPSDIIIDRSYIHGQPLKNTTRGIYNNGIRNAVIDSYIDEFHNTGQDAQGILHGEGRELKIVNNYLGSAGENFMSGGVGHTVVPTTTPSDITFTHNLVEWKLSWKKNDPSWDGKDWVTKNQWESKTLERALVTFNVFNRWWSSEQTGGSIAIKSSDNDKDPTVVSRDILWFRNHHKNLGSGFAINGSVWVDEESTDYGRSIWIIQNLLEINGDVWDDEDSGNSSESKVSRIGYTVVNLRNVTNGSTTSGSAIVTSSTINFTSADVGRTIEIRQPGGPDQQFIAGISSVQSSTQATVSSGVPFTSSGNALMGIFYANYPDNFRMIHNTFTNANAAQSDRAIHSFGRIPETNGKMEDFVVKDNIFGYQIFGIKCDGTAEGNASLNLITNSATRTWSSNLIAGSATNYPTGNIYVSNFTLMKFINFGNGLGGNYRLASDSPGKNTASDGTDMGVDVDALERATAHTETGNWPTTPPNPICNWHTNPACPLN